MQNPPPAASPGSNPQTGTSSTGSGLDPKIAAALSYIWIVGVIFFFIEKENRFVRFHALQSIIFGIANSVIMVVLAVIAIVLTFAFSIGGAIVGGGIGSLIHLFVWLIWLIFWLLGLVFLIGLVFAAIKAYQGEKFKLPIIGNMAENIVNK
ncbi:MAG TPA: DUF4870 domain-containing protein [Pyrinomonadaceae bacterium]|nr:DUF4870 domain-containing protein [Pyrinomonadaceae bacterium]